MQSGRTEIATGLARREPLRAPFAHRIRLNELQLELRAVPSMSTYTHDDLRADRLNGRFAPPDLPTSSGSFRSVQFSPVANNTKGPANGSPAELKPLTIGLQYSRALMQNRALLNQNEESALYLVRRGGAMSLLSAPPCRSPAYVFAW